MRAPEEPAAAAAGAASRPLGAPGDPAAPTPPTDRLRNRSHASNAMRETTHSLLRLAMLLMRVGPALMLAVLVIALKFLSVKFLTSENIGNVLSQTAIIALLAVGMLLVILTRGIDLSVGSTIALASVVGAMAFHHLHSGFVIVLVMLGVGVTVGLVNGLVYVYGKVPHPFIVTLAALSVVRGIALWLTKGQPQQGMPAIVQDIGGGRIGWLPKSAFLVAGVAIFAAFVCTRVVWGRWVYAVGGNPEAARRTGIPVRRVLVSVYAISGLCAGVAGVVSAGRLNAGTPTSGDLAELDAIAAVVIGGASFLGGRGNVGNAIVGALMIGVIRNGMNLLNINAYLQPIVIGVVILLAVELDVVRGHIENTFRTLEAARG